jgi:CheY-like chemotaxis protein
MNDDASAIMPVVMVVDDDAMTRDFYQTVLSAYGFKVILMSASPNVLERARVEQPNLILTDVRMPVLDGFQLCQQLKDDAQTASIPVILITGLAIRQDEREQAEAVGALMIIERALRPQALVDLIKQSL